MSTADGLESEIREAVTLTELQALRAKVEAASLNHFAKRRISRLVEDAERQRKDSLTIQLRRYSADPSHYAPMLRRTLTEMQEWAQSELAKRGYAHVLILNLFQVEISDDGAVVWEDPELAGQPADGGVVNGHPIRWLAMQGRWSIRDHPNAPLPKDADRSDIKDDGRLLFNVSDLNRIPLISHPNLRSQVERLTADDLRLVKLAALLEDHRASTTAGTIERLWRAATSDRELEKARRDQERKRIWQYDGADTNREEAQPRHREWQRRAAAMKKQNPGLSKREIARRLSQILDGTSFSGEPDTIRKRIK